jgi:hypothetical protein
MKKLAILASAILATSAFATGGGSSGGGSTCSECPEIVIEGNSFQAVAATSSLFMNAAEGRDAYAHQNVSSNSGNVTVEQGANSVQLTAARGSVVANLAMGDNAYASQNVSSNIGNVTIDGNSWQITALNRSGVINVAGKDTKAVQNLASNNGCSACKPSESHR